MTDSTMEEYMMKTRDDYRSGIARPKIDEKAHFELKGQFLKELRDNTFSGSDNNDANKHIEKVLEIVDLFHIPDVTQDQIMLRVFPMSLIGAEVILFYKGLDVPTRQILDSKGAIPSMKAVDAKKGIQDMVDHFQKWHNGTSTRTRSTDTSDGLAAIQAQLNNLGREIKKVNERVYAAQVGLPFPQGGRYRAAALGFHQRDNGNLSYQERRQTMEKNQGASIKALEIQIGQISKVLQERGSGSLPSSTEMNSRDHVMSISTTVETDTPSIRLMKRSWKITLRVGDDKIVFKSDKFANNIIRRVYALGLRERMKLDLEARLMGEALILNRTINHVYGDYIKLNDLNEPLELRRNQVEDLGPMIEDCEVIDEPMEDIVKTRNNDNEISNGIDEYPSFCDFDRKIHIDCVYNLQFSCMIGFEHVNANFFSQFCLLM
ncbi:hypothetical protein Tco_1161424 [Tanacetum coccineum]